MLLYSSSGRVLRIMDEHASATIPLREAAVPRLVAGSARPGPDQRRSKLQVLMGSPPPPTAARSTGRSSVVLRMTNERIFDRARQLREIETIIEEHCDEFIAAWRKNFEV